MDTVTYEVADRVATVTLSRPDRLNAWTADMATDMRAAMDRAAADPEVRAIVLTGAGRGFCAGADVGMMNQRANEGGTMPDPRLNRFDYLMDIDKPLLAAVNGPAAGIGLVAALWCDLRVLCAGAKLSTSFARRGLPAEYGSAWLLQRLVGPQHAADLLLSGRVLLAEEGAAMGLGRLLPADGFRDAAHALARELADLSSPRSVAVIKRQLRRAWTQTLAEAADLADAELSQARETDDFREGVRHHLEKRPPRFADPA